MELKGELRQVLLLCRVAGKEGWGCRGARPLTWPDLTALDDEGWGFA